MFSCIPLLLVSCTSTVFDESDKLEKVPISFSVPQTVTRAVVNDGTDLSDFRVWGWRRVSNDATEYFSVFDGEKVTKDSGWNYEGGIRYWNKGEFYDFYAVHPVYDDVNIDNLGNITINNFNCSVIGENAVDLMIAARQNMNIPQKIDLKFSHELSRLNFVVKSNATHVYINEFKINGIKYCGNFISGKWVFDDNFVSNEYDDKFKALPFELQPNENNDKVLGDVMVIPHDKDVISGIKLKIAYRYEGESELSSYQLNLDSQEWERGKSYNYIITILPKHEIVFSGVTVSKWDIQDIILE